LPHYLSEQRAVAGLACPGAGRCPPRGTVQVWSSGQAILLRDPKTVGDSVVGLEPLPDSTRHAVALTAIDSLRVQEMDPGKMLIVGTGVGLAVLYAYVKV
jgi:hypothetical protein